MIQSVIGPVRGVYVAMFACPVGPMGDRFLGCYKIYRLRPACYCDTGHFGHGETPWHHPSPDAALHGAALTARRRLITEPRLFVGEHEHAPLVPAARQITCTSCGQPGG